MDRWIFYAGVFAVTFVITALLTPLFRKIAWKTDFLDVPKAEQHKLHGKSTALLGGAAMFSGWILCVVGGTIAFTASGREIMPQALRELIVICICALAAVLLGLWDDRRPMKAGSKFAGQILIACAIVFGGGIRISCFIDNIWITSQISVFWILFILNAINFFDNMDGLAVGTSAIAFLFFTIAAGINGQYLIAALGACSCAQACGFWLYNRNPASIFMGDSGSHFLAFLLGIISSKVTFFNPEIASTRFAVLIPLFILAVPIFDTFAVVQIRLYNHKPIYIGDHNHISHRFLHLGMSRKRAVQVVHLLVLVSGLGALPLLWCDLKTCIILIVQGLVIFLLLTVVQLASRHENGSYQPLSRPDVLPDKSSAADTDPV